MALNSYIGKKHLSYLHFHPEECEKKVKKPKKAEERKKKDQSRNQ